jgi:hypothetical protein
MKKTIYAILITLLGFVACKTYSNALCEFPVEMNANVKQDYIKICEKGAILYTIHCANCHNTKRKGKEFIPDFTTDQLETYKIRNSDTMGITEEKVSAEELGHILTFLTYKKKNPGYVTHYPSDSVPGMEERK